MEPQLLEFIKDLVKSTLQIELFHFKPPFKNFNQLNHGIDKLIAKDIYNEQLIKQFNSSNLKEREIYFIKDSLQLYYTFFLLPDSDEIIITEAFLYKQPNAYFYENLIQKNGITNTVLQALKIYYSCIPIVDELKLNSTIITIASYLLHYKGEFQFHTFSIKYNYPFKEDPAQIIENSMKILEKRYNTENLMLEAVSNGNYEKVIEVMNSSKTSLPERTNNPIRDTKNGLIIMNTLCRKAAETGLVHPIYIDELSTKLAIEIEKNNTLQELNNLIVELPKKYCLLVKNYSLSNYSYLIRKAINYINLNISTPLSLNIIAKSLSCNSSYLSAQFKKETKLTITDYIREQRIRITIRLLNSTDLSIQEIASHVGIDDLSYFSKLFKKQISMSPQQYRDMVKKKLIN